MLAPRTKSLIILGLATVLTACTFTVTPEPVETVSPAPSAAVAATAVAPTDVAPTIAPSTAVPPTVAPPAVAPTRRPTATRPPLDDPTVPGFGSPNGLEGRITLPGYTGSLDAPVFEKAISFRLVVFDPTVGNADGDGITAVTFTLIDPNGNTVLNARAEQAAYCAFGVANDGCAVWQFSAQNLQWPNGASICAAPGYTANMFVEAADANKSNANWGFVFAIASPDGELPLCQ
jgi:hypothetical protein